MRSRGEALQASRETLGDRHRSTLKSIGSSRRRRFGVGVVMFGNGILSNATGFSASHVTLRHYPKTVIADPSSLQEPDNQPGEVTSW